MSKKNKPPEPPRGRDEPIGLTADGARLLGAIAFTLGALFTWALNTSTGIVILAGFAMIVVTIGVGFVKVDVDFGPRE